jgi:hypothetical protein
MASLLVAVLWLGVLSAAAPQPGEAGLLCQPAYNVDDRLRGPLEAYQPQPGDILFFSDDSLFWNIMFTLALSGHPHHVAVVVALPDGTLCSLECGWNYRLMVHLVGLPGDLEVYNGCIWVRRRRVPLTPEQSARLTAFALAQNQKPYASLRLLTQLTPFRCRGPLRTCFVGKPRGERSHWICSEMVVEAFVAVGLLDGETARPGATYPADLFFDRSLNLYLDHTLDLSPGWYPPARWVPGP